MGFPGGSVVKNLPANAGDTGSVPESGRSPGEGNGNPLQPVFLPGKSCGQRSLVGYSHGVAEELDRTEWLSNNKEINALGSVTEFEGEAVSKLLSFLAAVSGCHVSTQEEQVVRVMLGIPWELPFEGV